MARLSQITKAALIRQIGAAYGSASARIVAAMRGLDPASYTASAGAAALGRIRHIVSELDSRAAAWAAKSIKSAYVESQAIAETRLEVIGAKKPKSRRGAKPKAAPHSKAIERYRKLTVRDYLDANRTILTTAGRYVNAVAYAKRKLDGYDVREMQAFSSEEVRSWINRKVVSGTRAHLARKALDRQILDRLLAKLRGAEFVLINGRNYALKPYSELVARTRMRQAQTEAVVKASEQYESDLVEVPFHASPCDVCSEHIGQVFSLSGKSKDYPKLPDGGPPFHPNCLCYLRPVTEYSLGLRKKA